MNNLITFGCSFTAGNGCFPSDEYAMKYKKTDTDLIWPEILANRLDMNLLNFAEGLNSNDKIIDSIMRNWHYISAGDIVLIQTSFTHRYDLPNLDDDTLITVAPNSIHLLTPPYNKSKQYYTDDEIDTILRMAVIFDAKSISDRQYFRIDFLKRMILDYKNVSRCIVWDINRYLLREQYEAILDATNGEINDLHWSYKGHKSFAETMLTIINNYL